MRPDQAHFAFADGAEFRSKAGLADGSDIVRRLMRAFHELTLTITAGRVFSISPPTDGSKSTHDTLPLGIWPTSNRVLDQCIRPLERLRLHRRSLAGARLEALQEQLDLTSVLEVK